MKKIREIRDQKIWLKKDENTDDLCMTSIVITDPNLHETLFTDLEDKRKLKYITSKRETGYQVHLENPKFTDCGAIIYEYEDDEEYSGIWKTTKKTTITEYYYNPLSAVRNLLLGDLKSGNLLDLFQTSHNESESSKLKSYYNAQELIRVLKTSSLDNEIKRRIIENLWPNFAFYAFNGLSCTDINIERTYSIDELRKTLDLLSSKADAQPSQEIEDILSKSKKEVEEILFKSEIAQRNSAILNLAKEAHLHFNFECQKEDSSLKFKK